MSKIFFFLQGLLLVFTASAQQETRFESKLPEKESGKIIISTNFDHGSMGSLKEVHQNFFSGQTMHWIKRDKIGNQTLWFYFRMDNVPDEKITVQLENVGGTYRGRSVHWFDKDTQPVLSYDQKNWQRITDVSWDQPEGRFTFRFTPEKRTVWLAYAHPYTVSQETALINSITGNPTVKITSIGKSVEDRDMRLITITNPEKNIQNKKVILITALQHSGEDCGGYFMEGLIRELLSDKPEINAIRDKFIFKLIPVMNPDGLFHGTTRYNWNMEDLNTSWGTSISDTVDISRVPEVVSVKNWAKEWISLGNSIDLFLDVHSNSQRNKVNAFHNQENILESLQKILNNHWPIVNVPHGFSNDASGYFYHVYKVPSATIELNQAFVKQNPGVYLRISDYLTYGKGLVYSIDEYFN